MDYWDSQAGMLFILFIPIGKAQPQVFDVLHSMNVVEEERHQPPMKTTGEDAFNVVTTFHGNTNRTSIWHTAIEPVHML